jgi:hypothetical protein
MINPKIWKLQWAAKLWFGSQMKCGNYGILFLVLTHLRFFFNDCWKLAKFERNLEKIF